MEQTIINNTKVNYQSTNPEDFIEVLNSLANNIGAVRNLGVFADIVSVEYSKDLKVRAVNKFVNTRTENDKKSGNSIFHDNSPKHPRQYDYETLLNGIPAPAEFPSFINESTENNKVEDEDEDDDDD